MFNKSENLFIELFKYDLIDHETNAIILNIDDFKKLMDFMSAYAFQIFKKACVKYALNWKIYNGMDKFNLQFKSLPLFWKNKFHTQIILLF